jgi:hypothetical protein
MQHCTLPEKAAFDCCGSSECLSYEETLVGNFPLCSATDMKKPNMKKTDGTCMLACLMTGKKGNNDHVYFDYFKESRPPNNVSKKHDGLADWFWT